MKPYQHKIQYYETDKMQITHHSNYIRFMEEARMDFFEQMGWSYAKLEQEGVISPVVGVTCDYKKTTTFPDVISIVVRVLKCKGVKLKLGYTMSVEDVVVCTATSEHCFLDENGRPVSYKKQFPEFYNDLVEVQNT